jgi:hypothetical protein
LHQGKKYDPNCRCAACHSSNPASILVSLPQQTGARAGDTWLSENTMSKLRLAACLAILLALGSGVYTYYVYATGQSWDETFHVKDGLVSPSDYTSQQGYRYAIDHPSVARYVYRAVLFVIGVHEISTPDVDYRQTEKWNAENGRLPSLGVVIPLRFTNTAFMLAAVVLVYFTAYLILSNAWFALLVALPLVLSRHIAAGVVAYLGSDAILAFSLALSLFLWVFLAMRGRDRGLVGIVLISGVAALATSTKVNAALVIIAYMLYLAIVARGVDRLMKPLLAALVCAAIFVGLNPVMRAGGPAWMAGVISDMLETRRVIWVGQYQEAPLARVELVRKFLEFPAFILPLAGAFIVFRREKWALPLLVWSGTLAIGTLLSVNRTYDRYFLPIEMSVVLASGVMAWRLLQAALRRRGGAPGPDARPVASSTALAIAAGLVAALVLLTVLVAFEPWGEARARRGPSQADKVAVFYRQAVAYYGLAPFVSAKEIRERYVKPSAPRHSLSGSRPAKPLFDPMARQLIATAVFLIACALIVATVYRALGGAWYAALLAAIFLWLEATGHRLWMHSPSESFFALFAVGAFYAWVSIARAGGRVSWRHLMLAAVLAGAAMAATPKGVLLAAATAAFVVIRCEGRDRLGRAAGWLGVTIAAFIVMEPALWRLGAGDSHALSENMRAGTLQYWTACFNQTASFRIPIQERFPYLPLLPLAGCALYYARKAAWAAPLALWAGFIILGSLLTLDLSQTRLPGDVSLALTMVAGLPGLMLLRDNVLVSVRLKDQPPDGPAASIQELLPRQQ